MGLQLHVDRDINTGYSSHVTGILFGLKVYAGAYHAMVSIKSNYESFSWSCYVPSNCHLLIQSPLY